jgi:hypothetical protein
LDEAGIDASQRHEESFDMEFGLRLLATRQFSSIDQNQAACQSHAKAKPMRLLLFTSGESSPRLM